MHITYKKNFSLPMDCHMPHIVWHLTIVITIVDLLYDSCLSCRPYLVVLE